MPSRQADPPDRCAPPEIGFTGGAILARLRRGEGRGGALARAVGVRAGHLPPVLDATAGLGRDGFLLASLGCAVTWLERAPAIHAALAEALAAARDSADPLVAAAAARITLLAPADAIGALAALRPHTVLLDPMHPARGNSALVKLPMRRLRAIVGEDADRAALIRAALAAATHRVVLKWPRGGALPDGIPPPNHCIEGRTTRFDVFVRGG